MSMYEKYQVMALSEAAALWGLSDSTIRRAIAEKRIVARKSGGTWLITTADMKAVYGEPKPDTSKPTLGETFYLNNDEIPLRDIGRVPGKSGEHVLETPDGAIIAIGGYWLNRRDVI